MTIAATSTLADDARRLIALTAQAEDIDHQIRDIKARIAEAVPVGEKVTVDGQPVLSVRISGRRFDPKLAADLPSPLLQLCQEMTVSSRLAKANLPPAVYDTLLTPGHPTVVVL